MKSAGTIFFYLILISEFYYVQSEIVSQVGKAAENIHKGADTILKGVFHGMAEVIGTPVDIKEVKFYLHTSKDPTYLNRTIDPFNPLPIAQKKGKIYFLIHGWTQERNTTPWLRPFTEFILKKHPDAKVVQIDWSKPANDSYPLSAFATESVGKIIGNVIQKVVREYGTPGKNIVLIGHSLGGQITGWIGKQYKKLNNELLPRIIALDPAGPLFDVRPDDRRLNKHDADVVMVLHTNGGVFGFRNPCGTIDFFANGGSLQPGCLAVNLSDISSLTDPIWCGHRRAYEIFVEAVKFPNCFIARECHDIDLFKTKERKNDTVSLGDIETTKTGTFCLKTSGKAPFILHDDKKDSCQSST